MNKPLLISSIMAHADKNHHKREVVSVTADHSRYRYTYGEAFARSRKLANALEQFGLTRGDRVATLAWNDHRHFELYYAVSCSGFVLHTINPRLFAVQLVYIINHAEDRVIFIDPMFVPALDQAADQVAGLDTVVVLTSKAFMPESANFDLICYEDLLQGQSDQFDWPELDENDASALCYTSGTTGNPKGVKP